MAGDQTARTLEFGTSPAKPGGSEEGVGVVGAFSGRRVPSALQRLHSCVSLVVVCVSKKPKTFSSEMKYVTQMAELETGQRAMLKAILLRSHRKVSIRYRVPALVFVRLQVLLPGSGLVFVWSRFLLESLGVSAVVCFVVRFFIGDLLFKGCDLKYEYAR